MGQYNGPRTSDTVFFSSLIDVSLPELEGIPDLASKGDFKKARRVFADYVRASLKPDYFNQQPYTVFETGIVFPGETWMQAADRICQNHVISCGTAYQFDKTIDYFSNPTFNQYKEWTWQLSRHSEWLILGYAYLQTGDEKYAKACADQFETWVKQAISPEPKSTIGYETLCWRTIEAGIRMGSTWQYALHAFYKSPAFTDDIITLWYKSVWEHGERLRNDYTRSNWLLMEMDGLAQIGVLYPVLRDSGAWYHFAVDMLHKQLDLQFYPDGMQYELTTSYHGVSVSCYTRLMDVIKAYGMPLPEGFVQKLENTVAFYNTLIMPDFSLPDINDGTWAKAGTYVSQYMDLFPHRKDFVWTVSEGKDGEQPSYTSIALPYSGLIAMRTGWGPDNLWGLFDAAPYGRAHQHEDKLSLLLYMNGRCVLTEGGVYAYDDSEMRKYVLSTRSHNTVRVNGMDQNRGLSYRWDDDDIKKESDMVYKITDDYDYVLGTYNEGYGPNAERIASHERKVILIKNPDFTDKPFFIVIDRLRGTIPCDYEALWHLDTSKPQLEGLHVYTDEVTILCSGADGMAADLVSGQEYPEWQGWKTETGLQGDYTPLPTLRYQWKEKESRIVTVFCPPSSHRPMISIDASSQLEDTIITFCLHDGSIVCIDETKYR